MTDSETLMARAQGQPESASESGDQGKLAADSGWPTQVAPPGTRHKAQADSDNLPALLSILDSLRERSLPPT